MTPPREDRPPYAFVEFENVKSALAAMEEMEFRVRLVQFVYLCVFLCYVCVYLWACMYVRVFGEVQCKRESHRQETNQFSISTSQHHVNDHPHSVSRAVLFSPFSTPRRVATTAAEVFVVVGAARTEIDVAATGGTKERTTITTGTVEEERVEWKGIRTRRRSTAVTVRIEKVISSRNINTSTNTSIKMNNEDRTRDSRQLLRVGKDGLRALLLLLLRRQRRQRWRKI